jgi:hypothetical protein
VAYLTEGRRPHPWQQQVPGLVDVATLAGDHQLTAKSGNYQRLDPGGAGRNVDLPGPAEGLVDNNGVVFVIMNAADNAEALTIRDPADSTVVTIAQNERATVVGVGGVDWIHMGIETIALT